MNNTRIVYYFRTTLTIINLVISLLLLKKLTKEMFELMMIIGVIQYVISSLGYFSEFSNYLKIKSIEESLKLVSSKRFNFSIIPLLIIIYYYSIGNINLIESSLILLSIFMWVFSPYELYTRRDLSLIEELKIDNIRLIYTLIIRIITFVFLSKNILILGFFLIQLFPVLFLIFSTRINIFNIHFSMLYFKGNLGLFYGLLSMIFVKFDFFLASIFNYTESIYFGHKLEELGLLGLSLFLPYSQREIIKSKPKKIKTILISFIILILFSFFILKYFIISNINWINSIYFINQILSFPKIVIAFTILYFYNDLLYYKYVYLDDLKPLLFPFFIIIIITILIELTFFIFNKDLYFIGRIFGAIIFMIFMKIKLRTYIKINK